MLLFFIFIPGTQIISAMVLTTILGPLFGGIAGQLLLMLITTPINAGLAIMGIRRMANADIRCTSIFNHFHKIIPLFVCILLMYLLMVIGFILLVLPGIYLAIAYVFAPALMIDKNMGVWEALETSRKAVTHKWFTIFFTFIVLMIIVMISFIPLGIGAIWTISFSVLVLGKIYLTLFGVNASTLN